MDPDNESADEDTVDEGAEDEGAADEGGDEESVDDGADEESLEETSTSESKECGKGKKYTSYKCKGITHKIEWQFGGKSKHPKSWKDVTVQPKSS